MSMLSLIVPVYRNEASLPDLLDAVARHKRRQQQAGW